MGTQWKGMGQKMMKIPIFRQSVCSSSKHLKEYGFDLEKMILDTNEDTYKNTINSFVGLAAIQIGLIDCLNALGTK
jgi:fatty acid synthase